MANRRKAGRRVGGRLSQAKPDKLARETRVDPCEHILARRKLFAFVTPTKGPDGRVGEIDQDVCDGIGQLHALGKLDGHGIDPQELRDKGRLYGELYWNRYQATAPKMGTFERADKSTNSYDGPTGRDLLFSRMDDALAGYDRECLFDLVVDKAWGDDITGWAQAIIDHELLQRGRVPTFMRFPTADDYGRLEACIRALAALVDGCLPARWAA